MRNKTRLLRSSRGLAALSSTPCMMSTSMPPKEKCLRKGKASKAMAKAEEPDGVQHVMTIGSRATRHPTSQCTRPVKPKAKNVEWEESTWSYDEEDWHDHQWESEEYEASKGKKGKGKGSKPKGKSKGKSAPRSIYSKAFTVFTVERRPIPTQSQTRSTLLHDK